MKTRIGWILGLGFLAFFWAACTTSPGGGDPQNKSKSSFSGRAYVVNEHSSTISVLDIVASTGAMKEIWGSPFPAVAPPRAITISPAGMFAYVVNSETWNVDTYSIGYFDAAPCASFVAADRPGAVAVDPTGVFVYLTIPRLGEIAACATDPLGGAPYGALTEIAGSPFRAGMEPSAIAMHPDGKFLYAANLKSNDISGYAVNLTTGALTEVAGSPFAAGVEPQALAVDPVREFAYVANRGSNNVSAYAIDGTTGALTEVAGSPFAAGAGPCAVIIDPTGKFVYVANSGSNDISAYGIDQGTGALTFAPGSPFPAVLAPSSLAFDPDGKFLYATNFGLPAQPCPISSYSIDPVTGGLTGITGKALPAETAVGSHAVAIRPRER
jgi:6-phosphogluconolactonase